MNRYKNCLLFVFCFSPAVYLLAQGRATENSNNGFLIDSAVAKLNKEKENSLIGFSTIPIRSNRITNSDTKIAVNSFITSNTIKDSTPHLLIRVRDIAPREFRRNDTLWIYSGICKPLKIETFTGGTRELKTKLVKKDKLISVHGNIQYDYLYRSFADTPYYQRDFRQHTLQTFLNITVKEKYPFRVNFVIRKSNSPFFKDFLDGGLQFDRFSYYQKIKQRLLERIINRIPGQEYLESAKSLLQKQINQYNRLKVKLGNSGLAQQLIEERERLYFKSLQKQDVTGKLKNQPVVDSLQEYLTELVDDKKRELDSLQYNIATLQKKIDSLENNVAGNIAFIKKEIYKAKNLKELVKIPGYQKPENKGQNKLDDFMSNLKSVGIGRSMINYSELTARDVSLTGINLEYNSGIYAAVAAGKIDYGFRDFFGRNNQSSNQHLLMGRVGVGNTDKKAIIFSLFTGQKTNYAGILSDTVKNNIQVTGYSVEAIIKKNEETGFSMEIAKSTRPVTGSNTDNKERNNLFRYSDETNMGVSIKGQTIINETNTRFSGFFRKTGENFQSFSLFNYNTDQVAWMLRADQPLMKNKATITAMLRKNDFVNPFTEKTFRTTTVFSSVQVSVRIPKWPSVSIGYYPGSQLYIIDRNRVRENVYYILNGTAIHNYKFWGTRMVSSAIYNNYTSRGSDSGFINYNGINYMLAQSVLFRKLQLQGSFSFTDQEQFKFCTMEAVADLQAGKFLRLAAGVKYNKVVAGNTYWGGRGQLVFEIKGLGSLQLQYDKSFLPTIQQTLFPVETGRLTWFKNF